MSTVKVQKGKRILSDDVVAYGDRCRWWEWQRMETIKEVYGMLPEGEKNAAARFAIALVSAAKLQEKIGEQVVIRAVQNQFSIL